MAKSRRQTVRDRAGHRCEYCHLPEHGDVQTFQLDHIRAQKHSGADSVQNSAWRAIPTKGQTSRVTTLKRIDSVCSLTHDAISGPITLNGTVQFWLD